MHLRMNCIYGLANSRASYRTSPRVGAWMINLTVGDALGFSYNTTQRLDTDIYIILSRCSCNLNWKRTSNQPLLNDSP